MVWTYNGTKIFYKIFNKEKSLPVFLLHGWGMNGECFDKLIKSFPNKTFIVLDFPPFGKSGKNIEDWNLFSYAGMFMSLCEHLKIDKCDILGHSFGGRIAIVVCAVKSSLVHSCILVDSAGMKPKRTLKYHMQICKYKFFKKLGKDVSKFGSKDFQMLSPKMKKVFSNIVNLFLEDYAKKINCKTLIVWGKDDKETPLYMAKRLNKLVKNSGLEVIPNAGHFPFFDAPLKFYNLLEEFWED